MLVAVLSVHPHTTLDKRGNYEMKSGLKLYGSSSLMLVTSTWDESSAGLATSTGQSMAANSDKNCRHTPHGVVKECSWYATTAHAVNLRSPVLIAFTAAVRSAQTDGLKAPFSMLQPV